MKISYCIPIRNRLWQLEQVMPTLLKSAALAEPIEIVVLDYGSTDSLGDYIHSLNDSHIRYVKRDKPHYEMANARNLAALAATGEWILQSCADIWVDEGFFAMLRKLKGADFYRLDSQTKVGVILMPKELFIQAGGYDERFEYYGSEDRDLNDRLERRGLVYGKMSQRYVHQIPDPYNKTYENYRDAKSKNWMAKVTRPIYLENVKQGILVANEGKEWGK